MWGLMYNPARDDVVVQERRRRTVKPNGSIRSPIDLDHWMFTARERRDYAASGMVRIIHAIPEWGVCHSRAVLSASILHGLNLPPPPLISHQSSLQRQERWLFLGCVANSVYLKHADHVFFSCEAVCRLFSPQLQILPQLPI